jgi:hypothetical protein
MFGGIKLQLMIGPGVPVPVPQGVLDALQEVKITVTAGSTFSGFQLTFALGKSSPLHTLFAVSGNAPIPLVRVLIVATVNGVMEVLMDGLMTQHQATPGNNGADGTLVVSGTDISQVMNYIDFSGLPYPAVPIEGRIALMIAKYALFGMIPFVVPTVLTDIEIPISKIPRQKGKDLEYIKLLAEQVGYVFYVTPGPAPGASVAYFGPEVRVGVPQPALNVDMDAYTNVESINFTLDTEKAVTPVLNIQIPEAKVTIPIPLPNVSLLSPPLGAVQPLSKNVEPIQNIANQSPIRAALFGLAKAAKSNDVVQGKGTLNVLRYGRVLKARQLVGVRGVGVAFDGLYFVKAVTHTIKRGDYKQEFTLVRNGLVSTLPVVPV